MSACSPVQMGEIPSLKFISPVDLLNKLFSLSSFIFPISKDVVFPEATWHGHALNPFL